MREPSYHSKIRHDFWRGPGCRHGLRTLRDAIRGEIVTSADPSYESARRVWNGLVDRRPLLIAYCQSAEDIATCVRFAREREILIAVRSGGHACAGISVYDDGLVIDRYLADARGVSRSRSANRPRSGRGALERDGPRDPGLWSRDSRAAPTPRSASRD